MSATTAMLGRRALLGRGASVAGGFRGAATQPATSVLPVFPGLPATVPLEGLPAPAMRRSALPGSGLRVASQETYGQLCNFGVFIDAGSRVEGVSTTALKAVTQATRRTRGGLHAPNPSAGGTRQRPFNYICSIAARSYGWLLCKNALGGC
jgi:hypothetical protein